MKTLPWCVRHQRGWCKVKGRKKPAEGAETVPTACGFFIWLPWGLQRREPDCVECLKLTRVTPV